MRKSLASGVIASIDPHVDETWRDKIFFTMDVDWAGDEVLDFSIDLFRERGLKCTVFATHQSRCLDELQRDERFEIGLHPNYHGPVSQGTRQDDSSLDGLKALFPSATSIRSHSLVQSSRLQNDFVRCGLTHECNTYIPFEAGLQLRPWIIWNGLIKVPFVFADDVHLYAGEADRGVDRLEDADLCVVAFHPIHLYLNTDSLTTYEQYKRGAREGQSIERFVNRDHYGVRDLFNAMIDNL